MEHAQISIESTINENSQQLQRDGFLILENLLNPDFLGQLYGELDPHFEATPFGTGHFYGAETKRFARVLMRSPAARSLALHDQVMPIIEDILSPHCECLQLNLTQAIEIHPGAPDQFPHRDHDMWRTPKGQFENMINVMWALDDFTDHNGATRVWPGSNNMSQDAGRPDHEAISAVMPAGSCCLFLGSTLHSGGANRSNAPRRGLIISYCLGWLKPWENQWLSYPPHIARDFDPELAALVGYQQHLPSLGNFEGQCPSVLLSDENWSPFVDALRDDQNEQVRQYSERSRETAL